MAEPKPIVIATTRFLARAAVAAACLGPVTAQRPPRPAPVRGALLVPVPRTTTASQERGAPRMFESANLDRYLRKAQSFLAREDYGGAIDVLQAVIEGRVVAELERGTGKAEQAGKAAGEREGRDSRRADVLEQVEDDPAHAVFSADGRLYRPVRRLCHELLASMPEPGLALYRQIHEVPAERAYRKALAARDLRGLEAVWQRWFVTRSAARAMVASADLLMHAGRYRTAIEVLRTLLEVYPRDRDGRIAGQDEVPLRLRIALCLRQMREWAEVDATLARLRERHGDHTVRLAGEVVRVADLGKHALFAHRPERSEAARLAGADLPAVPRGPEDRLVPIWEYRFADPEPYRPPKPRNNRRGWIVMQAGTTAMAPRHRLFAPGTRVTFFGEQVALLDHFRLRVLERSTGRLLREGEGPLRPRPPEQGRARSRVPVYDWVALRAVRGEGVWYAVVGASQDAATADMRPVLENDVVAIDARTGRTLWTTADRRAPGAPYAGVTFLAAPTVFGDLLLAPVQVRGAYALQALDRRTGAPGYRVHLHTGGTELARPPAVPVVVRGGTAYVSTNAGVVAAVDAHTGDLLWARRYERLHPYRRYRTRRVRGPGVFGGQQIYREVGLRGFAPSDLIVAEGRVVVAPSDGRVLLCLDGATGEPIWMVSKRAEMSNGYVVGHDGRRLFVAGSKITCIDLRSGVRLWDVPAPVPGWRGRGVVTREHLVLPGERSVWMLPLQGGEWREVPLPVFSVGKDPLKGPCNLFASGPYLAACYEGGVEFVASVAALREMAMSAEDLDRRSRLLALCGDLLGAIESSCALLSRGARDEEQRDRVGTRLLGMAWDAALGLAANRDRERALQVVDRVAGVIADPRLRVRAQLLRVEVARALGDRRLHARERARLHRMAQGLEEEGR